MDDYRLPGTSDASGEHSRLAQWLQHVLASTSGSPVSAHHTPASDNQLELMFSGDYHAQFYQQLPDLAMAVLRKEIQTFPRFTHVLCHLAGCQQCHAAYLDFYDSLHAAVYPQGTRSALGQGTRTLSATPHRMLGHFCQLMVSQAEAELRQTRHGYHDRSAAARSLLQMALRVSSYITQGTIRREALRDLVRVATLFDGAPDPQGSETSAYAFTPVMVGGMRRGKVQRRSDASLRSPSADFDVIEIQSRGLSGHIVQQDTTLELRLEKLEPALRGQFIEVSVLLGSLLEPVRWRGGNPRAIQSTLPVSDTGALVIELGDTELRLSVTEDRNLLEAMFMLLEVRPGKNA